MAAGVYDIVIEQGATFNLNVRWLDPDDDPVDITGYSARMQVRRTYKSEDTLLSLTSEDGEIILGGALGTIAVTASAEDTASIDAKSGVYDLELVSPAGVVTRVVQGAVTVSPEVTK
jgi:hypothetical protein